MEPKLLAREEFREAVFKRDGGKCVLCGKSAKDAHHIVERRLWPDGGYYLLNGVSLCEDCHMLAEQTTISCEELRSAIKADRVLLPPHFDDEERYDKWGNIILPDGRRVRGELFHDESVQAILAKGGVLGRFMKYVKFPKIAHLPWSEGITPKTDRILSQDDVEKTFAGQKIVVTEKLDGENCSMYNDYVHARSVDGRSHPSRSKIKALQNQIGHNIPEGWRVCGENVSAVHSIRYFGLESCFYVFAVYDEANLCLEWDLVKEWAELLGLPTVPVLYKGIYDETVVKKCYTGNSTFKGSEQEGYVVRLYGSIWWPQHSLGFAKYVRRGHIQTHHNWMNSRVVWNSLKAKQGNT